MPGLIGSVSEEQIRQAAEEMRARILAGMEAVPALLFDAIAFAVDPVPDLLWEMERDLRASVAAGDRRAEKHMHQLYEVRMGLSREKAAMQAMAAELFADAMGWRLLKNGGDFNAFFEHRTGRRRSIMKVKSLGDWDHLQFFAMKRPGASKTYQPCAMIMHNYGEQAPSFPPTELSLTEIAAQIAVYRLPRSWYYPGHRSEDRTTGYLLLRLDRVGAL